MTDTQNSSRHNWKFESGNGIFFTSDTHFGHNNIIRFCNRPFGSVEEMNEALISNWNSVVGPDDIVFHLGDFAMGGSAMWNDILKRLNGHKILILGNHDRKNLKQGYMNMFDAVAPQMEIYIENQKIYLNHFPYLCFPHSYPGHSDPYWQLFGHVHSSPGMTGLDKERLSMLFPTQYDVGVDNNNYTPVSFSEVREIISNNINKINA